MPKARRVPTVRRGLLVSRVRVGCWREHGHGSRGSLWPLGVVVVPVCHTPRMIRHTSTTTTTPANTKTQTSDSSMCGIIVSVNKRGSKDNTGRGFGVI